MDIIAHGLWSGAIYRKKRVWWAVFFGVAPDLFSFGFFFVFQLISGKFGSFGEPPDPSRIPSYVYALYNGTHSLIIWAVAFVVLWLYFRRIPWEFTAWAMHILIDIPTHTSRFFPTPFLWPISQPFVINGISWGTPWFMTANYTALALIFLAIRLKKKLSK